MAKTLSADLRSRVLVAIDSGMSRLAAAERFGVGVATAVRWMHEWRTAGASCARPKDGDQRSHRIEAYRVIILAAIEAQVDITLVELGPVTSCDYVQASNDTWRTVAQVIGGAAFGLTFAWTVLQDRLRDKRETRHEANQMFIDGSNLLGKASVPERLAGIRILELITSERPDYGMAVRDIFVSMIAAQSNRGQNHDELGLGFSRNQIIGLDVQAAIDSIGHLPKVPQDGLRSLDLSGFYMVGGKFAGSEGFAGATFYNTLLFRSDFSGAHLEHTRFDGAGLSEWEAYGGAGTGKPGAWTDDTLFNWKDWERIRWVANFSGAHLENATFTGTGLTGAFFFGADLEHTDFSRANISRARFEKARNISTTIFDQACYFPSPRDEPRFDPSVRVVFDAPPPHPKDGRIYIDRCK